MDLNDETIAKRYLRECDLEKNNFELAEDLIDYTQDPLTSPVSDDEQKPYTVPVSDLARIHFIMIKRRTINVLEFGSGRSTAIMAAAMTALYEEFYGWVNENIRVEKPFKVFSIEEHQKFVNLTQKRLTNETSDRVELSVSKVNLVEYDFRYCTLYEDLPNISPDFIYLDGPSQFATGSQINGFSISHICRMPMAPDVLKSEFFFEPGTLILVDGRTANARFLKYNLKRNWVYQHDPVGNVHYFELQEEPLGYLNEKKLRFCGLDYTDNDGQILL